MATWIKVDSDVIAGRSVKVRMLARSLGKSYADTVLVLMNVWDALYHTFHGGLMQGPEIDASGNLDCLAEAMAGAGLAEATPLGYRLMGSDRASGVARYFEAQRENASKRKPSDVSTPASEPDESQTEAGGEPFASRPRSRSRSRSSSLSESGSPEAAETAGSTSPRPPARSPAPELVLELDPSAKPTVRMKPAVDLGPQRQVTDHFERRFFERTESKPTWRAEHFANLKPILAKIGAEAVCRRIDNLFDAPPFNLRDRFDFATFLRNVDAVAKPAPPMPMSRGSPGNGSRVLSDDDLGRLAEEARKKGF